MPQQYTVLDAERASFLRDEHREFALAVLVGLSDKPKRLSSRYFYDAVGSRIFQEIMELDEYYPTKCEREILGTNAGEILAPLEGRSFNLIDLGSGDGAKTVILLEHLVNRDADVRYVPIDISIGAMETCVASVGEKLPGLEIAGLVSDYALGIEWLASQDSERCNLLLLLGSNLGNFNKPKARAFLRSLWNALHPDDYALVGFDLKKDIDLLLDAYNDSLGVTARFNLNILEKINRELGGNFDVEKFRHFGTYDVFSGAMESYLVSRARQSVYVEALHYTFEFQPWEPIHTEYSYKFLESDIDALASDTGYVIECCFYDGKRYFADALFRVEKS